jgi:hypothetical protein
VFARQIIATHGYAGDTMRIFNNQDLNLQWTCISDDGQTIFPRLTAADYRINSNFADFSGSPNNPFWVQLKQWGTNFGFNVAAPNRVSGVRLFPIRDVNDFPLRNVYLAVHDNVPTGEFGCDNEPWGYDAEGHCGTSTLFSLPIIFFFLIVSHHLFFF